VDAASPTAVATAPPAATTAPADVMPAEADVTTVQAAATRRDVTPEKRPDPNQPGWGRTLGQAISKGRDDRPD
jgi:hypothetical protein